MNDTLCESFFLQPTQPLHRRYEVLRAAFVEHRPLQDVARQYGYRYGSLRNLVRSSALSFGASPLTP